MFLENETAVRPVFYLKDLNLKITKIIFAFVFTLLLAVSANIFIYLPFTPIPLTLQTLTVFFAAITLGSRYVLISMGTYIAAGFLGLPVFAGFKSGILALIGPTGGFIIGFLISSFITALAFEKLSKIKKLSSFSVFFACLLGTLIIYFFGYSHMLLYFLKTLNYSRGENIFINIFNLAIRPFLTADLVKITILTGTATFVQKIQTIKTPSEL